MSSQSTPRKRGRPPLTKNYDNPMESPMAHSSIAVQKLGGPNFIKPMMKVDMMTPKKRKQQNGSPPPSASSSSSFSNNGTETSTTHHENDHNNSLLTHSGRYRGVILNTPLKNNHNHNYNNNNNNANTSLTPDSSSQMSTPHMNNKYINHNNSTEQRSNMDSQQSSIFSSAKKNSNSPTKNQYMDAYLETSTEFSSSTSKNKFSLSLNINSNGKASIGPVSLNNDNNISQQQQQQDHHPPKLNNHIIDLLKQMKYNNLKENTVNKLNQEIVIEPPPTSASSSNNDNQVFKIPKTPKFDNNNHTLRTGFTPLFTLDKLLSPSRDISTTNVSNASKTEPTYNIPPQLSLPSDVTEKNNKNMLLNTKLAFKVANDSGDPILMNEDSTRTNINSNSSFTSPKITVPTFNTPPSFMNLGSPNGLFFSPFNKKRNPSILMPETSNGLMDNFLKNNSNNDNNDANANENNNSHTNDHENHNETRLMEPPKTPKFNDEMLIRNNVPWSPYIQTLLENNNKTNSQSNKYIHDIFSPPQQQNINDDSNPLNHIDHKSDINNNNSDDARFALRNLINEG